MPRSGFHTITLGCKLNRFDSAALESELTARGLAPQPDVDRASLVIVNTCTVTAKADADARRLVRSVRRRNRTCRLLVTGCYAEREAETLRRIPGVDLVFGNRDKERFSEILDRLEPGAPAPDRAVAGRGDRGCGASPPSALRFGERARAFLRVQEGCDLRCSYCVIPAVRGASRSVPPAEVERGLRALLDSGYHEVVLTGVNTGDYGRDLDADTNLASLLRRLLGVLGPNRLRLNSLEPLTVTDEIIELVASEPRIAPHLQVPLQAGSEPMLRAMRRNYRLSRYRERVERLRRRVPHAGIGADVIVGFPGETDAQFEDTLRFVRESPLNYLHVFAWSARPGTPAAGLPNRVHGSQVRERSARLRSLGDELSLRFRRRFVGQTLRAVILGERDQQGRARALTGNFIEVAVEENGGNLADEARGRLRDVRIVAADARGTAGVWPSVSGFAGGVAVG